MTFFVPPDTSFAYVTKLRNLIKQEEDVREKRKEHFFSEKFVASEPGHLFPYSWTTAFEIARGRTQAAVGHTNGVLLQARPDYKAQASAVFDHVLKTATPAFDKTTEDGLRFRIYRFGSLEVRTTQEHDGKEVVGVVFSVRSTKRLYNAGRQAFSARGSERFVKITEYIEAASQDATSLKASATSSSDRHSYVVLETEQGTLVVTEKRADGTVTWDENPKDLEDRNSLAKVIRSMDCAITVQDMRRYQMQEARKAEYGASSSACKRYAQGAYSWAGGDEHGMHGGFGKPIGGCRWRLSSTVMDTFAKLKNKQAA